MGILCLKKFPLFKLAVNPAKIGIMLLSLIMDSSCGALVAQCRFDPYQEIYIMPGSLLTGAVQI
jgi:hypothetical protein